MRKRMMFTTVILCACIMALNCGVPCKNKRMTKSEIIGTYLAHDENFSGEMVIRDDGFYKQKIIFKKNDSIVLNGNWQSWRFDETQLPKCYGQIENYSIDFENAWSFTLPEITPIMHTGIEKGWSQIRIMITGRDYWEKQSASK